MRQRRVLPSVASCRASGVGLPRSGDEHGRSPQRPPLRGDDRLFEPERGEQTRRLECTSERDRRPLELRWEVERVHRVEPRGGTSISSPERVIERRWWVFGRCERDDIGTMGAERPGRLCAVAVGDRGVVVRHVVDGCVDVDRDHVSPAISECSGDARARPDPDLQQSVVSAEFVDKRTARRGYHVAGFMTAAVKNGSMLVDIVPVGEVTPRVKREASAALRSVYDCDVTVHDDQAVPESAYDAGRGQYRAEDLIEVVGRVGSGEKNIGITPRDLYYRRRNYVFGLAYLNGSGSVISTHRLRTSSDGGVSTKPAIDVFSDRVRKEVVHEIGHTLGLEHCDNSKCVMSFSPTVREVDVKEENLCGTCSRLIR